MTNILASASADAMVTMSRKFPEAYEGSICPSDIDARVCARVNFFNTFGHYETESSAWWVVWFCQNQGSWEPFSFKQIDSFYRANRGLGHFTLNRLVPDEFIILMDDGKYRVTEGFISACHRASPV
ncbi:MAG: hypothetical protein HYV65_02190 [Candidatus Spechtbacteria bacterium]|nr:hypothetical protein [Candidatus Spechtbacteria bacterium]